MAEIIDEVVHVAIFPIKSCGEATVYEQMPESLEVGPTGFQVVTGKYVVRDRDFVIYDPNATLKSDTSPKGSMVSQRGWDAWPEKSVRHPDDSILATVKVDIRSDHISVKSIAGELEIPTALIEGPAVTIDMFGYSFPAVKQRRDAADYFTRLLKRDVQLVRADHTNPRMVSEKYQREGALNQVAGADSMPILMLNRALFGHLIASGVVPPDAVDINRYRGNIIINGEGLGLFGEDFIDPYEMFWVGTVGEWAVKGCVRCRITENRQETGETDGYGLRLLHERYGVSYMGSKGLFFGQNLLHKYVPGQTISEKDIVRIAALSERPNVILGKG